MARKAKQPKGKRMNPTFFVFCEGKTEAAYVDLLRRNFRVPVEIIARVSDSNISKPYIDRCKRDRFTTPEDTLYAPIRLLCRNPKVLPSDGLTESTSPPQFPYAGIPARLPMELHSGM